MSDKKMDKIKSFPILDREFLNTRKEIAQAFLPKLVDAFEIEVPKIIKKISVGCQKNDPQMIREFGHKLKGMCLNMGAIRLSEFGKKVEESDFESCEVLITQMEQIFQHTLTELKQLL